MNIGPELNSHRKKLVLFARRLGATAHEADDIVQETFVNALRFQERFDGTNLAGWLSSILRNCYMNQCRNSGRRGRVNIALGNDDLLANIWTTPAQQDDVFLQRDLERALAKLKPLQRACIEAFNDENSYAEVAKRNGLTIAQVKGHIHKGRQKLLSRFAG